MYENETGSHLVYLIFSRRLEGWNLFICVPCFSLRFKEMDLLRERERKRGRGTKAEENVYYGKNSWCNLFIEENRDSLVNFTTFNSFANCQPRSLPRICLIRETREIFFSQGRIFLFFKRVCILLCCFKEE